MQTVQDFFDKYNIDEFYEWQSTKTQAPVHPFIKGKHTKLSHGIIPGFRKYDLFYERYLSAVEVLQAEGAVQQNIKVLDIGSGEGFFKFFFDALCPEKIQWHGVEVWPERAALCKHLGYTIAQKTLENGELPYESEEFDIVLASHVLEHIPNPGKIISEMGRVLKKGGHMVIGTPTKPPIIADLDSYYHKISNRTTGDTQQAFTHGSLQRLILKSVGVPKSNIIDKRGFRIFSARKKLPLENWKWFYDASTWISRKSLLLVPEVNIIVRK